MHTSIHLHSAVTFGLEPGLNSVLVCCANPACLLQLPPFNTLHEGDLGDLEKYEKWKLH